MKQRQKKKKGSRFQSLLMGANFVIPKRQYHFKDEIVNSIYRRREQGRIKRSK